MLAYVYNNNAGTFCEIHNDVDSNTAYVYFIDEFDGEVLRHFTCDSGYILAVIQNDLQDFVKVYEV